MERSKLLSFSGTNYLGINRNADFQGLVQEGISRYGLHYGGSRFSRLCPDIFAEAERMLCEISGAEAAVIVSSGTVAGHLVTSLLNASDKIFIASGTHSALLHNLGAAVFLKDDWEKVLSLQGANSYTFLSNSVDPLYCKLLDFSFFKKYQQANLIIDDSHGIGILGAVGSGVFSSLKNQGISKLTVTASLGKAFGIPGGCILSDRSTINQIKNLPMFGGGAPPPPAYSYAFVNGQAIYKSARRRLQENIQAFKGAIQALDRFEYVDQYPVFYTTENDLAATLLKEQILLSSFRYPTPESDLITRVVINSSHTAMELERILTLIHRYFS